MLSTLILTLPWFNKRPGFKFLKNLGNENIYANAKWFYIHRDGDEKYIGCIKGTAIYIWNATSGVQATVTYTSNANTSYLTGTTANDYDVLTVQDTTLITNKQRLSLHRVLQHLQLIL